MFRVCFGKPSVAKSSSEQSPARVVLPEKTPTAQLNVAVENTVASPVVSAAEGQPPSPTTTVATLLPPSSGVESGNRFRSEGAAPSARPAQSGLNAIRILGMQPENVTHCEAQRILEGVRLSTRELGRGSYGVVVSGTYQGLQCAVKVMLTQEGLDRAALRELLLGPSLQHPNIVSTYLTRCAVLTHEFFDFLEGGRSEDHITHAPRMLEPVPLVSGDGFGDPLAPVEGDADPMLALHMLLHSLEAKTGNTLVVVVQQFCDKGTLKSAINSGLFREREAWPERVALRSLIRTASELARGLLHLHEAHVVHGDVKPANVLLSSSQTDRRGFNAKVADFGLCHLLPEAATSMYTGSWGSIAYMAPEAFDGKVSRATDVWSFGVCLWQMLTGLRPYSGLKQRELADVIKALRDGKLRLQWPDVAPQWQPLVMLGERCTAFLPDQRPTFQQVVNFLVAMERGIRAKLAEAKEAQEKLLLSLAPAQGQEHVPAANVPDSAFSILAGRGLQPTATGQSERAIEAADTWFGSF